LAVIHRSPESKFDSDIREINESGIERVLQDVETAYLSDSFWDSGLIPRLINRRYWKMSVEQSLIMWRNILIPGMK